MAKPLIDLHLHTYYSDGTFTPEQVAKAAEEMKLAAISLTDHDTIEGCDRLAKACDERNIEFIPGTELSVDIEGYEMHLLGYFLDTQNERLITETTKYQQNRTNRVHGLVDQLNELGIELDADDVFDLTKCKAPGRPHVARALVKLGFCGSVDEAFPGSSGGAPLLGGQKRTSITGKASNSFTRLEAWLSWLIRA